MKKNIILVLLVLLLVCGCGKTSKLQDGKEVVVSLKNGDKEHKITAEDLYKELKDNFGLQATIKLFDNYILENEFEDYIDDAKEQAENYIQTNISMWGSEEKFLTYITNSSNYSSIESYKEAIYTSLMQNHAMEEYAKEIVTDKEIQKYYKDEVEGDIELYQILITSKATSDMSSTEKSEAEDAAKKKAEEVIKKLNDSKDKNKLETFKSLVKEYSEDETSKEKDGNMGYLNFGDLDGSYDSILKEAYKLKNGEYSKKVITTELGYHVIFRNATKEKDKLEDIKDKIIEKIAEQKVSEDKDIYVKTLKYYHKKYNLKINDDTLERQYGIYLNNLLNQEK